MFTCATYAAAPLQPSTMLAGTGVDDLDRVMGGLLDRSVVVITGQPRSGRSMLSIQFARLLSQAGSPVRYALGQDRALETMARLRAATEHRPLPECRTEVGGPTGPFVDLDIEFDPDPHLNGSTGASVFPSHGAFIVDDLDLRTASPLDLANEARHWVQHSGRLFVATVPVHVLDRDDPVAWQGWARSADVIVETELWSDGDARLRVLSNRRGPVSVVDVEARFHYAQFRSVKKPEKVTPTALDPG